MVSEEIASGENSPDKVESDLSHPSIFNPDAEDGKRRVWAHDYFFTISLVISGLWVKLVFRLPEILLLHSGGTFMLVFTFLVVFFGIPFATLETFAGQYGGKGFLLVMTDMMPVARGVGYVIVMDNLVEVAVYGAHMSQLFIYLYHSFKSNPPWERCAGKYNTLLCTTDKLDMGCMNNNDNLTGYMNGECVDTFMACMIRGWYIVDKTHCSKTEDKSNPVYIPYMNRPTAQEEYYRGDIRNNEFNTLGFLPKLGAPSHRHVAALTAMWVLATLCAFGTRVPKPFIPYVTYTVPLAIYIVFLFFTLCLPGIGYGIGDRFFVDPKTLFSPRCWADAAEMTCACMSIGYGTLPALAARNKAHRRSYVDVATLAVFSIIFALLAALGFYALLGHLATIGRVNIGTQLAHYGARDLARVYFSTVLGNTTPAPLWSVLYFATICLLGVGSLALHVVCVIDEVSSLMRFKYHRVVAFAGVVLVGYFIGFFFTLEGAIFILENIERCIFGSKRIIFSLFFLAVAVFAYGRDSLIGHISRRLRVRPSPPALLCRVFWWGVCPLLLALLPLLAALGRNGTVFELGSTQGIATIIKVFSVLYEFYWWPALVGLTVWAWRQPLPFRPRGVWRRERADDDVEVAAPVSYQVVTEANDNDSWQTCA